MERAIGRKLPGTKPLAAAVTYGAGTRTEAFIHGVRVVFWVPRGSHTIGDLLGHLPDDKVLVAGDVLVSRVVPTLQDGFVKNWWNARTSSEETSTAPTWRSSEIALTNDCRAKRVTSALRGSARMRMVDDTVQRGRGVKISGAEAT
jgi:hypothetical protein